MLSYALELSEQMISETVNKLELSRQLIFGAGPLIGIVETIDFGCCLLLVELSKQLISGAASQSAMHHGVPVRVFFRRSSEHHSRNDSSSSTSWNHDSHVFSHSRTLVVPGTFLRVLYNNIHHHVCLLYTSPSPRDRQKSRMPSSA